MGGRQPTGDVLLRWLAEAFDARAWHGTPLSGALRGVTAARAAWRPGAGRHNIWEVGQIQLLKRLAPRVSAAGHGAPVHGR